MEIDVFIDVQNDFIDGALPNERAIAAFPKVVEFAKACKAAGNAIYATRDTHDKDTYAESVEGKNLPVEHCIEQTYGWQVKDELLDALSDEKTLPDGSVKREYKCVFVNKGTFGSFDLPELIEEDAKAKGYQIDKIVLCGFVTPICVLANAVILRAKFPNTKIVVKKDLCAGLTDEGHEKALYCLKMQMIDVE